MMSPLPQFEYVFNFRDIGGYRTPDGKTVKSNHLYRSGAFSAPTSNDLTTFAGLGIKLLIDLRGQSEQDQSPNKLPATDPPATLSLPIWPTATNEVEHALLAGTVRQLEDNTPGKEPDTPAAMRNFYRSFVRDHRKDWSVMLAKLCEPQTQPAVIHCAGGKDRTGVATAIILLALGIPRDIIMEDYLKTNIAVDNWIATDHPGGLPPFFLSVMRADPGYLKAALSEIDETFGGFENYLVNDLNVSKTQRTALQSKFLG